MGNIKDKIEFEAMLKKVDLFSETLHIIVFPKGSITNLGELYEIKEVQKAFNLIQPANQKHIKKFELYKEKSL